MKLTDEEKNIITFALSGHNRVQVILDFFAKMEEKFPDDANHFNEILDYARRKNAWVSNESIIRVKHFAMNITTYADQPFYDCILNQADNFCPLPVTTGSITPAEIIGQVNDTQMHGLALTRNLKHTENNLNCILKEDTEYDLKALAESLAHMTDEVNQIDSALQGILNNLKSLGKKRVENAVLGSLIENYKNPDFWLTQTAEVLIEDARNYVQSFESVSKALSQINQISLEFPVGSTYKNTGKSELHVLSHDYDFKTARVVITLINNEGTEVKEYLLPGETRPEESGTALKSKSTKIGFNAGSFHDGGSDNAK